LYKTFGHHKGELHVTKKEKKPAPSALAYLTPKVHAVVREHQGFIRHIKSVPHVERLCAVTWRIEKYFHADINTLVSSAAEFWGMREIRAALVELKVANIRYSEIEKYSLPANENMAKAS